MKVIQKTSSFGISKYIKIATNTRIAGMMSTFMLMIFAGLMVYPIVLKNSNAEATVVPSTTELVVETGKNTASVDITPGSSAGSFAVSDSSNEAAFTVTTNNLTGYSLNLTGNDTTGRLINNDIAYIDTLSSDVDETTFINGAAATYNNKWGYRLTFNGVTSTNYLAAPTTSSRTIYTTTAPNTTADSFAIGVGVRADYTKPAGSYTNTFVLNAVGNPISYQINYLDTTGPNGTTGSDVLGLPEAEDAADVVASAFTLSATIPTKTDYTFSGWCDGTVTHTPGGDSTCSGTVYQAGDAYTFSPAPSTGTATANLYAMWEANPINIQDFTATMCQAQASSDSIEVMDARDDNRYTVRYINGNCWMTQNLRYVGDTGSTSGSMIMKSATSNTSGNTTLTYTDLTNGNDYDEARIHNSGNTTNGVWYNYAAASAGYVTSNQHSTDESIYSVCPAGWRLPTNSEQSGITPYKDAYFNGGSAVTGGFYLNGSVITTGSGLWWSSTPYPSDSNYRYYLYYDGSSLGTNFTNRNFGFYVRCIRNTSSVSITFDGNGATSGSMSNQVFNATGTSTNISGRLNPNTFTRTGYYFAGWNTAADGSGTNYDDNVVYSVTSVTSDITVTLYAQWIDSSRTIQDFTKSMCSTQASSNIIKLRDARDDNVYSVRYINGNCWMVQNLKYVGDTGSDPGSMVMKATTSNINADTTISYADLSTGNSYDYARIHDSGNITNGVWYNYAAASVMTITGSSNTTNATYDVCPKGWKLPTNSNQSSVTSYRTEYNPVTSGWYDSNGNNYPSGFGIWWSSTSGGSNIRYRLLWEPNNNNKFNANNWDYNQRYIGLSVRCIRNVSSTTVTFNGNGATGGSMNPQVINTSGSGNPSGALNLNAFTRAGYRFTGWNTAADGSGTSYADGATYTATTSGDTAITLYASWTFDGPTMQNLTAATCESLASSQSVPAIDARDDNIYNIRYINGNCWMTQNLRFTGTSLSSSTSNVADTYTDASPYQVNSGNGYADLSVGNDYTQARIHVATSDQVPEDATYTAKDMGVWYNYAAASAGTITGSSSTGAQTYDICPKGWKLPSSEFSSVYSYVEEFAPITGGYYKDGNRTSAMNGDWWGANTAAPNTKTSRREAYYNGKVIEGGGKMRQYGCYIRCVLSS